MFKDVEKTQGKCFPYAIYKLSESHDFSGENHIIPRA